MRAMRGLLGRSRGRRGVATVRGVLGYLEETGEGRAHAGGERRFLRLCRRFDLPLPEVNVWIALDLPAGGLEVDFCWREQRLVVEVDSHKHHRSARAFRRDRERDRALALAGWRVLRFTWPEITAAAHTTAAEIRAHLTLAAPRRPKRTV